MSDCYFPLCMASHIATCNGNLRLDSTMKSHKSSKRLWTLSISPRSNQGSLVWRCLMEELTDYTQLAFIPQIIPRTAAASQNGGVLGVAGVP